MFLGRKPSLDDAGLTESQKQNVQAIFDLLERSAAEETAQRLILTALHLTVSALDGKNKPHAKNEILEVLTVVFVSYLVNECRFTELSDDCLPVLRICSKPATLQTLERLVSDNRFTQINATHPFKGS